MNSLAKRQAKVWFLQLLGATVHRQPSTESVTHRLCSWPNDRRVLSQNFEHVFCTDHLNSILFALSLNTFLSEMLHNLWDPVQNKNAEPLPIPKLRISTWQQQRIKPSKDGPFCTGRPLAQEAARFSLPQQLKRKSKQGRSPPSSATLPESHQKGEEKSSKGKKRNRGK